MIKARYLRHPIRTAKTANALVRARLTMRNLAASGRHKYNDDPRYDLQNVTDGFASRLGARDDDSELLERICAAYIKTVRHPGVASEMYKATSWWEEIRQRSLRHVIQALMSRDIRTLRRMYQNFFRDPCSTGLLNVPYGMSKAYFGGTIKDVPRNFYLSDTLHRLDYWSLQTRGCCNIHELSGPEIGNPFGICLDDTLIRAGSPYQHYCAYKVSSVANSNKPIVVEIGGGFGGMAYYLLRDCPDVTYVDFDLPESIALTSYYLLKAFPQLDVRLFGELDSTYLMPRADVLLMPLFKLSSMPAGSADIVFSSHAMADLSDPALQHYLQIIGRVTRDPFLYVGNRSAVDGINRAISRDCPSAVLVDTRLSGWNDHTKLSDSANELECLYRFNYGRQTDIEPGTFSNPLQQHGAVKTAGVRL
jgi:hypothetical protein